jgi:hypothetical protein
VSRLTERLEKLQRKLDAAEQVIILVPPQRCVFTKDGPRLGEYKGEPQAIGGTAKSRAKAIAAWKRTAASSQKASVARNARKKPAVARKGRFQAGSRATSQDRMTGVRARVPAPRRRSALAYGGVKTLSPS